MLDNILVPNEKLPAFGYNADGLDCSRDRLESLLLENRQLRDLLADKEGAVNRLSSQVSDAVEKMSQQSFTEADLLERIKNLECAVEEARLEVSVNEDVYKCLLREVMGHIECIVEVTGMEHDIMKEIYYIVFRDAVCNAVPCMKCELEDSDLASIAEEGVYAIMFKEAREKIGDLNMKERALKLESEKLKQDILNLEASLDEKEKLLQETAGDLEKEKNQFELVSQELHELRYQISQQQILISKCNEESNFMNGHLLEALQQIECDKVQLDELNQKFEQTMKELRESNEKNLAIIQDQQNALSLVETREEENREQMESVITRVHGLSKAISDVEYRIAEDLKSSNFRLENLGTQLSSLNQKAKNFKILELQYKKKLERRCCDLQKAEAEVDLLGDEVDALLSLLEKIYIALDHYSPILRHYPGIIEILKLVRRELSGESIKTV